MITTSGAVLTAVMVLLTSGNGWPRQTPAPQSLPTILVEQLRSLPPPTSIANAENARWDDLLRLVKEAPTVALPALADALNGSDSAISGNAGSALWMLAVGQTAQGKNAPKLDMYPILTKLLQALESANLRTRASAADVLSTVGPRAAPAVPALVKLLEDENDPGFEVRSSAAMALGRIGPSAKAALPSLLKLHSAPHGYMIMMAQFAIIDIGGRDMVPPSPAPGGIQLLPRWSHIRKFGIDTQVGVMWRQDGLEIGYEIGFWARQIASDHERSFLWTRKQIVDGQAVHVTMRPNERLEITFEENSANFSASPIRTEQDLAEVLLMVMSYTPGQGFGVQGIYSNIREVFSDRDLTMEVTLVSAGSGHHAVVQIFDNDGPHIPVVVPAVLGNDSIAFTIESKEGTRRFSGTFTDQGLVGALGDRQVKLRRGRSFWQ